MAQIAYVDWDGLVYYDGKIKQYISDIADGCLKAGGKIPFAQLPRPSYDNLNYVYKITDSFTSTNDFDKPGYKYEVGALVQVEDFDKNNTYRYTVIYEPIKVADISGKVEELERAVEEHSVDIGALANDVDSLYSLLEDSYAKKSEIPSIHGLASEDYVDQAVSDALANVGFDDAQVTANTQAISALSETVSEVSKEIISVEEQVENVASAAGSLGATIDVIQAQLSTKAANVHTHKLSEIDDYTPPNLAPYATTEWVNKQDFLQQQDLSSYAKKDDIPTKISELSNDKEFATEPYVNEQLAKKADSKHLHDNYATVESIPTKVSTLENDAGYVTTTELNSKGYITEHQSLEGYAKTSEIPKKVSSLANDAGYLTRVPDEYITNDELQSKGYLTYIPSEYITSEELDARGYIDHHQSLEGYVKFAELSNFYSKSNTYSKVEVDNALAKKADTSSVSALSVEVDKKASKEEVKAKLDASTYDADKKYYALKSEIVTSYNDLTDKPDIDSKIYNAINGYATESFVAEEIAKAQLSGGEGGVDETTLNNLLSNYYKKSETYSKGEVNSLIPNIDGYATQQWVTDKGYITALDISGKADKSDIPSALSELTNDKGFITEKQALDAVAKVGYITDVSDKLGVETYESDKKSFALKSDIPSVDRFITAEDVPSYIPEEYVTNDEITNLVTKEELESVQNVAGQNSVKLFQLDSDLVDINAKLDTIPTKVSDLENDAGYITATSLQGYATEQFVKDEIGAIDIPEVNLSDYYTKAEVGGLIEGIEIPTVPTNISAFTNDAGYLTEHIDISGKLDLSVYNEEKSQFALASAIPTSVTQLDGIDGYVTTLQLSSKADVAHTHSIDDIEGYEAPDYSDFYNKEDTEKLVEAAVGDIKTDADNKFALKSDLASLAERVGVIEESEVSVDLTDYYTKADVDRLIPDTSNFITMGDVEDKGYLTEHQDISGKQDVLSFEGEYNANTNRVATKSYVDNALSSINLNDVLSTKANNVPFNKSMIVTKPIGNLEQDEDLCGRTIAYILTKMLGLEEQPEHGEVTVEDVKEKSIPVMQGGVSTSDGSTKVEDANSTFTYLKIAAADSKKAPVAAEPGTSAFYEIKNDSDEVIEHGYQIYTIDSGRGTYWRVSIPVGLVIKEVQMYDAGQSTWTEYTPEFTDTGERMESNGYDYVVYQSSDRANEEILRFILE